MKKYITPIGIVLILALFTGCSLLSKLQSAPPTGIESELYNITTNYITTTNVVNQTNLVTLTNAVGALVTNAVVTPIITVTNMPQYKYVTAPGTTNVIAGIATAASIAIPGSGTIVMAALTGLAALWGGFKTKQASTAQQVSTTLAQTMETARNIIAAAAPQVATQFDNYLMNHQMDAGVANEVATLVDNVVNKTASSNDAVQQLVSLATTPIAVTTATTAAPIVTATATVKPANVV